MLTSLPDLPFTNYGNAELDVTHSSTRATPRAYPRTDLQTLTPWTSFPNDIHQAIQAATTLADLPSTPFAIEAWTRRGYVENEEGIHSYAGVALHAPVEQVLEMLGVNERFAMPGGGNAAIVGAPDFLWVKSLQPHLKVIVEYKTWWVADLTNVVAAFNGTCHDILSLQSLDTLQQIYRYMTFNNNKFGILTNWRHALFLRRAETSDHKTVEYYLVELDGHAQPMSMLKAWVGMALLAEEDWFYASLTPSSVPPGRNFGISAVAWRDRKEAVGNAQRYHMQPIGGDHCLALDFRVCSFDLSSARCRAEVCVVNARLLAPSVGKHDLQAVCKVVDVLRYSEAANLLAGEARAYAALKNLQGEVIPTLYGFYEVWGILRLLALEPVGNAIPEDEQINQTLRTKIRATLQQIHDAGFIHGHIARRNICRTESGNIFLVDLERCQPSQNPSELDDEMNEVDGL